MKVRRKKKKKKKKKRKKTYSRWPRGGKIFFFLINNEIGPRGGWVFNTPREPLRRFGVIFMGNELGRSVLQHGERLYFEVCDQGSWKTVLM